MAASTSTNSTTPPSHFYLDEKWKLSKKEGSSTSRSRSSTSSLMRNSSTTPSSSSSSSSTHSHSHSHKRCAFTRKCARLVKDQRARFYIMRRCVTMLVCWRDYGDS